jgi:hypothetical protein
MMALALEKRIYPESLRDFIGRIRGEAETLVAQVWVLQYANTSLKHMDKLFM